MARAPKIAVATDGSRWQPLGGTSRRYRNIDTGETLSRTVWDERYGRLKRQGFRTPHAQRAASRAAGTAQQRPAIGRGTKSSISGLHPLANKISREIRQPVYINWLGDPDQFYFDALEFQDEYDTNLKAARGNSYIQYVQIRITYEPEQGAPSEPQIVPLTFTASLPNYSEFLNILLQFLGSGKRYLDEGGMVTGFVWHISFKREKIPSSKYKMKVTRNRQLRSKRGKK